MDQKSTGEKLWAKQGTDHFTKGCCITWSNYFTIAEV